MKTYARIENNAVVELLKTAGDISEMFHPDMMWVDVTDVAGIAERWKKSGAVFTPPPAISPAELKATLCRSIDAAADAARLVVVGDALRVVEYERAAVEAQAFKDAGYGVPVPLSVKSWAEAKGWTAQQSADDILAASAAWNQLLYSIRDARLKAKEAVKSAADENAAQAVADAVIAQIKTAVGGSA